MDGYFTGLQKELNHLVASFPEIDKTIERHQYHFAARTTHPGVQSLRAHG